MQDNMRSAEAGWRVGESIAMELDMALAAAGGNIPPGGLSEEVAEIVLNLPEDWKEEWPELMGEKKGLRSVLELAAVLGEVLFEGNYSRVTLAIRELTLEDVYDQIIAQASAMGLADKGDLAAGEGALDLWTGMVAAGYRQVGLDVSPDSALVQGPREEMGRVFRIVQGGDLHTRFWHWLDRFYYEIYAPWRQKQRERMQSLEQRASIVLGAKEKSGQAPEIDWLSAQNPILRVPELRNAVEDGLVEVFFWVEPFGISDLWSLYAGQLIVSFAEPGALYENFQEFAGDLADRAQALADPTRLTILRIIRHFGMMNTEMAAFLNLSRPTVSVHAKILREAGLIRSYQEGRMVKHEIIPDEVRRLFRDLERFLDLP